IVRTPGARVGVEGTRVGRSDRFRARFARIAASRGSFKLVAVEVAAPGPSIKPPLNAEPAWPYVLWKPPRTVVFPSPNHGSCHAPPSAGLQRPDSGTRLWSG